MFVFVASNLNQTQYRLYNYLGNTRSRERERERETTASLVYFFVNSL